MRFALQCGFVLLALATISAAKELPDAPGTLPRSGSGGKMGESFFTSTPVTSSAVPTPRVEARVIDKKFLALTIVATGSTFADSYTTLFARQNWLAGKQGVCNMEVESTYLYGTHPTVARTYAVAAVKGAGSALAAYYLRRRHNRFWSLPLLATAITSLQGVGQNLVNCN